MPVMGRTPVKPRFPTSLAAGGGHVTSVGSRPAVRTSHSVRKIKRGPSVKSSLLAAAAGHVPNRFRGQGRSLGQETAEGWRVSQSTGEVGASKVGGC